MLCLCAAAHPTGCHQLLSRLGIGNHLLTDALSLGTVFSSTDSVAALQVGPPPLLPGSGSTAGWRGRRVEAGWALCAPVL